MTHKPNAVRWHITIHAAERFAERFPGALSKRALKSMKQGDPYPAMAEMEPLLRHAVYDKALSTHPHHTELDRRKGRERRFLYVTGNVVFLANPSHRLDKWDLSVVTVVKLDKIHENLAFREAVPLRPVPSYSPHQHAMLRAKHRLLELKRKIQERVKMGYTDTGTSIIKDQS